MKLNSISASKIKTFQMCKFKFWLHYEAKETLRSNYGASFGTLVHDILENYATGVDKDWVNRLYKGYAGVLATKDKFGQDAVLESPLKWAKDKDFKDKKPFCDTCPFKDKGRCKISGESLDKLSGCPKSLFEASHKMTEIAIAKYTPIFADRTKILGTEYNYEVVVPDTEVKAIGVIDLILEKDPETIEIVDYKTGTWVQDFKECEQDIQVRMYSWVARKEFIEKKGYKNVFLTFDYFTASPITIAFSAADDGQTEDYLRSVISEIQDTKIITRIIGDRGFDWKCKSLCDTEKCQEKWSGKFEVKDDSKTTNI